LSRIVRLVTFTVHATYAMLERDGEPLHDHVLAALGPRAMQVLVTVARAFDDFADRPRVTLDSDAATIDAGLRIRLPGEPEARRVGLWCIDKVMSVVQSPTWEAARLSVRVDRSVWLPGQRHS
jgi:hypothetical protein